MGEIRTVQGRERERATAVERVVVTAGRTPLEVQQAIIEALTRR